MHQLFLDSNSYLAFYSLAPGDIAQLAKLAELIELGRLKLLLPSQVSDEVRRNRGRVVAERIKPLQDGRLQVSIPQMLIGTETANELKRRTSDAQRIHSQLLEELRQAANDRTLPADLLIQRLFRAAVVLADAKAIDLAGQRKALGNPPGKGSSLGDGVNWEILLARVPMSEDLCLVSADGDFSSALDPAALDDFLSEEWAARKRSSIDYYRDIKQFLDDKFPHIRLASDVRKYFLIGALLESPSFAESHSVIAELNRYDSFTTEESLRLLSGGMENNQVRWLARDEDMLLLLSKVLAPHRTSLPSGLVTRWDYLIDGRGLAYGGVPTDEDLARPVPDETELEDELPF